MSEFTAFLSRGRSSTLTRASFDWLRVARENARADFPFGFGPPLNPRCTLNEHLEALRTNSQRPSTPQHRDEGTDSPSPSDSGSENSHVIASKSSQGTGNGSNGSASLPPEESPPSSNEAYDGWPSIVVPTGDFDLGGADNWREFPSPPPPKDRWGPHCGHKYRMTNTEYIHTAWRYDVVTDVEIYRVSTIPDDFIGSSPLNNWTFEVVATYHKYKEVDNMSEELELIAQTASVDAADLDVNLLKIRYYAALRAAALRIDFLRKWPSAFEQHEGTLNHWERALELLRRAKRAKLDGIRAFQNWPLFDPFEDAPDVPVPATSNFLALGLPAISAAGFASVNVNNALGDAIRPLLDRCCNAKSRIVRHIEHLRKVSGYSDEKILSAWEEDGETATDYMQKIFNIASNSHYLTTSTMATDRLLPRPDFPQTPFDVAARLGKPVFALSPQQYEQMRLANDANKADLRTKLNEDEDIASLEGRSHWEYTIESRPEAGYPDLPALKPELEGVSKPENSRMKCSEQTFRVLAGFWPNGSRLGSREAPKC